MFSGFHFFFTKHNGPVCIHMGIFPSVPADTGFIAGAMTEKLLSGPVIFLSHLWQQGSRHTSFLYIHSMDAQLDFIDALTTHDRDFTTVRCRYYTVPFIYNFRGLPVDWLRDTLLTMAEWSAGLGDYMEVTPYALHFGWLHQKQPFYDFAERTWKQLTSERVRPARVRTNGHAEAVA